MLGEFSFISHRHTIDVAKKIAMLEFVEKTVETLKIENTPSNGADASQSQVSVSVGFSDDDTKNVLRIAQLITEELKPKFPTFRFVVYDSSNPSKVEKKVL